MKKLFLLAIALVFLSLTAYAERFSYLIKSVTNIQNGIDRDTSSKNGLIVVDTDNSTLTIEGQSYQITSSAWGNYPETYFYAKSKNNQKVKVLIDYDRNYFIIDFLNGNARKYRYIQSFIN